MVTSSDGLRGNFLVFCFSSLISAPPYFENRPWGLKINMISSTA